MNSYERLKNFISETTGFNPESTGEKSFIKLIESHMNRCNITDMEEYLHLIESDYGEFESFYNEMAVYETWFFRDRGSFQFLKRYSEDMKLSKEKAKKIRILSVPCSTGEEPYSIAITLLETGLSQESFHLDAVDLSRSAISQALLGVYKKRSFRDENRYAHLKEKYFVKTEEGFMINEKVKKPVSFYIDNIVSENFLIKHIPYNLIFCKNLFIYLTDTARKRAFENLKRLILPDGILIVGHPEVLLCLNNGFELYDSPDTCACVRTSKIEGLEKEDLENIGEKKKIRLDKKNKISDKEEKKGNSIHLNDHKVDTSVLVTARGLADRGKLKEALHLCEEFLENHRENKEVYFLMGLIQQAQNRFQKAEGLFLKALYLDPSYYEALVHMYLLYEKKGFMDKASVIKERIKRLEKVT